MTNTAAPEKRGPGRPPRQEQHAERRRKRSGVTGFRLGVSLDKLDFNNFAYRWFNDEPGGARMHDKTVNDDWDIVSQDGGALKNDASDGAISIVVGTNPDGSAKRAYLCRKRKEWFDEDQNEKSTELEKQVEEMRRGNNRDGSSQSDYVPTSGIRL